MARPKQHVCDWPAAECKLCKDNEARKAKYRENEQYRLFKVEQSREYRREYKEVVNARDRKRAKSPERKTKQNKRQRLYYQNNLESSREYGRNKYARTKHKGTYTAQTAKRRAQKEQASPTWLTPAHYQQIKLFYQARAAFTEETGQQWHVDHIVPLLGKDVCGLHVPWNLCVLPKEDNLSKSNRIVAAEQERLAWPLIV